MTVVEAKKFLKDNDVKGVLIAGHEIALRRAKGKTYALQDRCLHRGVRMSRRPLCLTDELMSCWYHGYSYGFNAFGPIYGGWATWRRAWREYDYAMATWPEFRDSGMMAGLPGGSRWRKILQREWEKAS